MIKEKVKDWSEAFNLPVNDESVDTISPEEFNLDFRLVEEEFKELDMEYQTSKAVKSVNINNISDHIGDTIWVLTRMAMRLGIDVDEIISEIYRSNMSKLCRSQEEAFKTVKAYKEGKHPDKPGEVIHCHWFKEDNYYIVRRDSDNKILKNINYKPVNFGETRIVRLEG